MSDPNSNPYQAPQSRIDTSAEGYADTPIFAYTGRLGRLRFIAYYIGLSLVLGAISALLGLIFDGNLEAAQVEGTVSYYLSGLLSIGLLVVWVGLMIRRVHDFGAGGGWVLLMLLPLINLIFLLVLMIRPGDLHANRFGKPPPPNTTGVKILAFIAIGLTALMLAVLALYLGAILLQNRA